jgi:hypothetical protein
MDFLYGRSAGILCPRWPIKPLFSAPKKALVFCLKTSGGKELSTADKIPSQLFMGCQKNCRYIFLGMQRKGTLANGDTFLQGFGFYDFLG